MLLEMENENAIIDVGDAFPDNWNLLKQKYPDLRFPSILIFSHAHIDHICSFAAFKYYAQKEGVIFRTYATKETMEEILKVFHWLTISDFGEITYLNYGEKCQVSEVGFIPLRFSHGKFNSTGLVFGENVFLPDFDGSIPKESASFLNDARNIIMECNNLSEKLPAHNNLQSTLEIGRKLMANGKLEKIFLTHLGDEFPNKKIECQKIIESKYPNGKLKISAPDDLDKIVI